MKTPLALTLLTLAGLNLSLGLGSLRAADANFTSSNNVDSQLTKSIPGTESASDRAREATGHLQPRPSGIIYSISKDGLVIISPTAPAQYGNGEQFLTANANAVGATAPATNHGENRDFGGLKLFGWDF